MVSTLHLIATNDNLPPFQGEGRGGDGVRAAHYSPIPLLTSPLKGEEPRELQM